MPNFIQELRAKMASYAGVVYVNEEDERRLLVKCQATAATEQSNMFRWSTTDGLVPVSADIVRALRETQNDSQVELQLTEWAGMVDPVALLREVKTWKLGPSLVLAFDLFTMLNRLPTAPMAARLIKDITAAQQAGGEGDAVSGICQLVVCDREEPQLETPLQRLSVELPDRREMSRILDSVLAAEGSEVQESATEHRERILNSLMGLSALQAGNAIMESLSRTGSIDADLIRSYKKELVAAKGLTWVDTDDQGFSPIGGLTPLKNWLTKRANVMMANELRQEYGVGTPKGVICAGVPGAGKSFAARCLASYLGVPLLQMDVGATRGMYQGQSENDFAAALTVAESVPCVLFIDEAEKAFGGSTGQGASTDGGTGSRVLGTFLTWMQENQSNVFVYMTANRPEELPPELMRAGRTSGQFWFTYPTASERASILNIMIARYPKAVDVTVEDVLPASDGCTGAEIEASFEEAAITAMMEKRNMTNEDVVQELRAVSRVKETFTMSPELEAWSKAAQRANDPEAKVEVTRRPPRPAGVAALTR